MKICTITSHDAYNYGASLQAYALMSYLQQQGYDVSIIDYKPEYTTRRYNYMWVNPESGFHKYWMTRAVYRILKFIQRQFTLKRKKAFDKFTHEYLNLTRKYESNDELKQDPPLADAYIVGSDQVWNSFYDAGKDPAFYLDFAPAESLRISYAASFSITSLPIESKLFARENLQKLNSIAVREEHALAILNDLGLEGTWVLDPTFLLPVELWKKMLVPFFKKEPYLLIYDFEGNKLLKKFAIHLAQQKGIKIYAINDTYPLTYADKNFGKAGPKEFITLIYHCDYFISNSFHGSVFSILFNKRFFIFPRNRHKVNSRMESLLKMFEKTELLISNEEQFNTALNSHNDPSKTQRIIEKYLAISKEYLKRSLSKSNQ